MNTNPLHNAMIKYVCDKRLMMLAIDPDSWWRFKNIDGVRLAENHTVADLAKIFKNEIIPNMRDYQCVACDPIVKAYMDPLCCFSFTSDNGFNINDYRNISWHNVFEAQGNKDKRRDSLNVTNPIVTDDIILLAHFVSTETELERGSVPSMDEMVARLRFIQNEKRNCVNLQIPTLENIKKYQETVAAMHNIDGTVRIFDIMEKNPKPITSQNLPLIVLDPNRITEQTDSQYLSIFGTSDTSVSCTEQRPSADHHRNSDMLQSTTIDSCNPDLDANRQSTSSIFTVNESVPQIAEITLQETTANEVDVDLDDKSVPQFAEIPLQETTANERLVDMDEIASGNSNDLFSSINWQDLTFPTCSTSPFPTCNASSEVANKKRSLLTSKQARRQKLSPKILPDGARPLKIKQPSKVQARPATCITSQRRRSKETVPSATKHDCSTAPIAQSESSSAQPAIIGTQFNRSSPPTNYSSQ